MIGHKTATRRIYMILPQARCNNGFFYNIGAVRLVCLAVFYATKKVAVGHMKSARVRRRTHEA